MKKLLGLILFFTVSFTISVSAQRTVSGTISDTDGIPLIGANVLVNGTDVGTITDIDGSFSLTVPDGSNELLISYAGYTAQTIDVTSTSSVNISLAEGELLNEVVVTALGIEKEERSLGYSVDKLGGEELVKSRSTNIVNALQGKVTGVQINNSSGNVGASSQVIIRGITSLSGRNTPLWVVDGVPFNDNQFVSNGTRISGNRDFGNGASVLNPDDIEDMTVLKGAAATALYGSRAAAGVIIVTTKKGSSSDDNKARVEINSSYRFDDLMVIPDYQQDYVMGSQFKYDSTSVGFDWGPRNVGQQFSYTPITGEPGTLPRVADNGVRDFFETGNTFINNFSISDGTDKMDYRLSLTALNQTGVVPGSELDRYTVSLNSGIKHSDKLESRFGVNYVSTATRGVAPAGANDPNIIGLGSFSGSFDTQLFRPWIDDAGNQINQLDPTANNYYWLRFENRNDRDDDRVYGNFSMAYKPFERFTLRGVVGLDYNQDSRFLSNRKNTAQRLQGDFTVDNINNRQLNTDITAGYDLGLTGDVTVNALAGFNANKRVRTIERLESVNLLVPELFAPGNAELNNPTRLFNEQLLYGLYGSLDIGYKDWASLTLTGRNDWSSTLPVENRSYFYPSASLAIVFTDALDINSGILNYGKLRLSAAQVGNDTNPYQLDFVFNPITTANGQYGLNVNFPFDGRLAFAKSNTIPPANLRPEEQTSYEIGTELDLFNYKLGLDLTYYATQTKDQILALPIPESTGFANLITNVGQVNNSGIEATIDINLLSKSNFSWNSAINFTTINTDVVELAEGVDRVLLASAFNSVQVVAVDGGSIEILGVPILRDSISGLPIINPDDGSLQAGEATTFGSVLPDFNAGFINSFTFGNFGLSFSVDWSSGGVMNSATVENLQTGGLVQETLANREGTMIINGVIQEFDVDGNPSGTRPNDVPLVSTQGFWGSINDNSIAEPFIYDASFVKLREVAFNYRLPSSLLDKTFFRGISIGLEARNVALLWSRVPHIDPELNLFGSGSAGFGIERNNIPSTRTIGVNLKAQF